MSEKTAFGGDVQYQDFKSEGRRVATEGDSKSLMKWVQQLQSDDPILVQQAAAVCYSISDIAPELFNHYQKILIQVLKSDVHPAAARFTYRLLAETKIDEDHQGEIIDLAFRALTKSSSPVAIKVFAMSVIANHIKQYPDLAFEVEAVLSRGYEKGSPGFKSRAKKIARIHGLRLVEKP